MDMNELIPAAITFVAVGVLLSFGLSIQSDVRKDFVVLAANCGQNSSGGTGGTISYAACGYAYNATLNAQVANSNLSSKLPILATVIIASIVVAVLIKAFVMK
jgi:hypothetical protein